MGKKRFHTKKEKWTLKPLKYIFLSIIFSILFNISKAQPSLSASTVSNITSTTADLGGTLDSGTGITERGTVWNTSSPATLADNKLAEGGTSTGVFSHTRSSLPPKTLIYFAPYAIDGGGAATGPESSFYTLGNEPGAIATFTSPSQTTTTIDLSWAASTNAAGYLIYQATGATAPSPTLTDGAAPSGSPVADLSGTSTTISGLTDGTAYSFTIVPYDWDNTNAETYNYGPQNTLTSVSTVAIVAPSVINPTSTSITSTGATLGGEITSDGGDALTERGIYWSTSSGVTTSDTKEVGSGTATGVFSDAVTGFSPKTQIFFKAYASNSSLTGLSSESSFFTLGNSPGTIGSFTSPTQSSSSIDLQWSTSSNAAGYLIYQATGGSAPSPSLTDGAAPTGSPVANITPGTTTSTILSGLTATSEYSFAIVPYDWDGANSETYNYGSQTTLTSVFTQCAAPTVQASGLSITDITGGTIQINWTPGNGNGTLILIKEGSAVNVTPSDGTSYTANLDFTLGENLGGGNIAVYAGHTSPQIITGLNTSTDYYIELYEFNTLDNCYLFTASPTDNATTLSATSTSTITDGSGAATISSIADTDGEKVAVFTFTMRDLGDDGTDTEFTQMIFSKGPGDEIADWSSVIADAKLYHNEQSGAEHGAAIIAANTITIPSINNAHNRLGEIDDGEMKTYELKIYLKSNLGSLKSTIDGLHLAFELDPANFSIVSGKGGFDPATGTNSNSNTGGANDHGEITVDASKIVYTTQPSTSATATVPLAQQPILEARDVNDNVDLDFAETLTVTTPSATLTPSSAPAAFSGGYADFTGSGFNFQTTGTSEMRVTTSPSSFVANSSSSITVSASTTVAQVTGGIASSPLNSDATNQALLGFSLVTTGSILNFTEVDITTSSDPDGKIKNIKLYRSVDADYSTSVDNTLVAATVTTPDASTIQVNSFSESISGVASYYFIVADVETNVFATTPSLQLSLANANDITVSTGSMLGSSFSGTNYSFVDVTQPTIVSITAQTDPVYDGALVQSIVVVFSEPMNTGTNPSIAFASSTNFTAGAGNWSTTTNTNDTWTQTFTHNGTSEEIASESVSITSPSGATDVAGNADTGGGTSNSFVVDTKNPTATVTVSTDPVTQPSNIQTVTVTYDEPMNPGTQPTINFGTSSDFTSNSDGVWSVGNTVWTESFTHGAVQEEIAAETAIVASSSGATDVAGNTDVGDTSPSFVIDTKGPVITSITTTTVSGPYTSGAVIDITVNFDENAIVTGSPYLEMNTTASVGQAVYLSGTGTSTLIFRYTVGANQNANPLDVASINLNGGALKDGSGNNSNLVLPSAPNRLRDNKTIEIDTKAPTILSVTSTTANGFYNDNGNTISIQINFDEPVTVSGIPQLALNSGGTATYSSGSLSSTLTFNYTVGGTDNANPLDYAATNSLTIVGASIVDHVSLNADLTLPTINGGNSIQNSKTIVIDTDEPTVSTLSPSDNSFNNSIGSNLVLQFNEKIALQSSGQITITNERTGLVVFTYDLSSAPEVTQSGDFDIIINPIVDLDTATQYHVLIEIGAILDQAGNSFAGFADITEWNFVTYGPPHITSVTPETGTAVCIGENVVINGINLTGTTQVTFSDGGSGIVVSGADVIVDSDTLVRAKAPLNSLTGTINVRKDGIAEGNPDVNTSSMSTVKLGPSSAALSVGSIDNSTVCSSGTITTSTIKVDVVGGTSNYSINYKVSSPDASINELNYTPGNNISVNPPYTNQINIYSLVSVTDAESCSVPVGQLSGTYQVYENARPTVDAGGQSANGLLSYYIGDGNTFQLDTLSIPPTFSSVGPGAGVLWSKPASSNGSFSSTTQLGPDYTIGSFDIYNNSVLLTITTTNNPAACDAATDTLLVVLEGDATATPALQGGGNKFCWDGSANPIVTLEGTVGGGATTGEWKRDVINSPGNPAYQGFDSPTLTLTSTNLNATYRFNDEEQAAGFAYLTLEPTNGPGSHSPEQIKILLISNPIPKISTPNSSVCEGEPFLAYSVDYNTGSSYQWTVPNGGGTTFSGQGTENIRVDWGTGASIQGMQQITVTEINSDNCLGSDSKTVTVNALPYVEIVQPNQTGFASSDEPSLLEGNQPISSSIDKLNHVFAGNGVVRNGNDSLYYFNPNQAVTGVNDINYTYTDGNGCTNTITRQYNVFDAVNPVIDTDTSMPLEDEYCEDSDPVTITFSTEVETYINNDPNLEFLRFEGFGISGTDGDPNAVWSPSEAFAASGGGQIEIKVVTYNTSNGDKGQSGTKVLTVYSLPSVAIEPIPTLFCDGDSHIELLRTPGQNQEPGSSFEFYRAVDDPDNFIQKIGDSYFIFPENAGFVSGSYSDLPKTHDIVYSYTSPFGCTSYDTTTVTVYQTPPVPIFESSNICVTDINNLPTAVVTNQVIDADIEWYNNETASGSRLSFGTEFTPTQAQLGGAQTDFYAFQVTDHCMSPAGKVTYEQFTDISIDPATNCVSSSAFEVYVNGDLTDVNSITWNIKNSSGQTLLSNDTRTTANNYAFSQISSADTYTVTGTIESKNGCQSDITEDIIALESVTVNDVNFYKEDFESNSGSWVPENVSDSTNWQWGAPSGSVINSTVDTGNNVWMTGLTNGYLAKSNTNLYSACFDISALDKPMISLDTWYNTNADDGTVIQFTSAASLKNATWHLLGSLNSGDKWYNAQNITANPGSQATGQYGWSSDTLSGWVSAKHVLEDPNINPANLILRIQFKSESQRDLDGMAVDNIRIGNRTRNVLLENFTSSQKASTDNETKAENDAIRNFAQNTTSLVAVQYHPDIDGADPVGNSSDANARALYYGIGETPRVAIDGKADADKVYNQWAEAYYSVQSLNISPITITTTVSSDGTNLQINSSIKANETISGNFVVQTLIVKNTISADEFGGVPSNETEFDNVVLKMLPSPSGQLFADDLLAGNSVSVANTYSSSQSIDMNDYSIIVFAQDVATKKIYQTEVVTPTVNLVTSIQEELDRNGFAIYPNPASSYFTLLLSKEVNNKTEVTVYNQVGQVTYTTQIRTGEDKIQINTTHWVPGIYYVQTELAGEPIRERIIVQHK